MSTGANKVLGHLNEKTDSVYGRTKISDFGLIVNSSMAVEPSFTCNLAY